MKKALVIFAQGFEEIEALTPVDILRRAGVEVTMAGLHSLLVTGSHQITVTMDTLLHQVELSDFDLVFLPGGLPGAQHLKNSDLVMDILKQAQEKGILISAICAAPIALDRAGVLAGKSFTNYPGFEKDMDHKEGHTGAFVQKDGLLITGIGAGAAPEFALALVEALGGDAQALRQSMHIPTPHS